MTLDKKKTGPLKQRVKVVVRVRPQLETGDDIWVRVADKKTLHTLNYRNTKETLQYEFETVFGPEATQAVVYNECVEPLLARALNGQNASVFAYGPTGAGKTHTILGTAEDPGIIPRCLRGLFSAIEQENCKPDATDWKFKVSFSYLEVYQEKVYDLLNPGSTDLPIREDQQHKILVAGLTEQPISDIKEFTKYFAPASKNRTTAATKLNERSSRSHSVLLIKVIRIQNVAPFKILTGKLYIIDLAGSEDNRRTGNQGIRLKESGCINSSLLALSQVVDALNKGHACIPYRSSKLTRLLQDSLGGSAHTCMIVNLAPEERHYFDTYTTLHFARRTKKIINHITIYETAEKIKPVKRVAETQDEFTPKKQKTEPVPFISPMLKNQEKFQSEMKGEMKEVVSRLTEIEQRILEQMKTAALPRTPLCSKTKDDQALNTGGKEITNPSLEQLEHILKELQEHSKNAVNSEMKKSRSSSSLHIPNFAETKKRQVFSDGSVLPLSKEDISASPLFLKPKLLKKRRFTSTAARRNDSPDISRDDGDVENISIMNVEFQKAHNDRILMILNTGTVKELKDLQTVGEKRAKLIHDWRTMNGHFKTFDDLRSICGLSSRYVDKFLKSNLVRLDCE